LTDNTVYETPGWQCCNNLVQSGKPGCLSGKNVIHCRLTSQGQLLTDIEVTRRLRGTGSRRKVEHVDHTYRYHVVDRIYECRTILNDIEAEECLGCRVQGPVGDLQDELIA